MFTTRMNHSKMFDYMHARMQEFTSGGGGGGGGGGSQSDKKNGFDNFFFQSSAYFTEVKL